MRVLVIDIGGTHVKMLATGQKHARQFESSSALTPNSMVQQVLDLARDWEYETVSVGYPGLVGSDGPTAEPENLGTGWVAFNFAAALGKPVEVVNDAAMQALGSYQGGRMLFLGLGTALGSTLVMEGMILPLELGQLPLEGEPLFELLGKRGLAEVGRERWQRTVEKAVEHFKGAFIADEVVLGGGHAELVDPLPQGARRGNNELAFEGGFRLWEDAVKSVDRQEPPKRWRVFT